MSETTDKFDKVSQTFQKLSADRVAALRVEMERIGWKLVSYVQSNKLEGQVLHKRGGKGSSNLYSHVTQRTLPIGENTIFTRVGVFSGVPYARIHEYGGQINIPEVKGKLMAFGSSQMSTQLLFDAPGHTEGAMVFTRKHKAYTVTMPERSYLRSSLRENRDAIIERMRAVATGEQK